MRVQAVALVLLIVLLGVLGVHSVSLNTRHCDLAELCSHISEISAETWFRNQPKLRIRSYAVNGNTREELIKSLRERGPFDDEHVRRQAKFEWRVWWNWSVDQNNQPNLDAISADYVMILTFPEWKEKSSASAELQEFWENYTAALYDHEKGHAEIFLANFPSLEYNFKKLRQRGEITDENAIQEVGNRQLDQFRIFDRRYDDQTQHGKTQGVTLAAY